MSVAPRTPPASEPGEAGAERSAPPFPPRVLVATTYYHPFVGGVESHVRRLAAYLVRRGSETTILTKTVGRHRPGWADVDGVPVFRVPPGGERKGYQKWAMIPPLTLALLGLGRRFDVVYCPDYRGIGMAAVAAGRLLGRPVVLGGHNLGVLSCASWDPGLASRGLDPEGALVRALKWPVVRAYRSADAHTGICREIVDEARRVGVPEGRIHHVPNAVDLERFRPPTQEERRRIRREEGWADGEPVGLFVGRLSAEKGILELLEAWASLEGTDRRARLAVVGPDMPGHAMDVGERARAYVRDRGLGERVAFHGARNDVPRLLRGGDFLLQPSHYESFGISVIEAMATGLPVVASRVGGMVDYLVHGWNALLCPPASPPHLARAASRLLGDGSLRARLGAEARRTVEREFGEERVFGRLTEIFVGLRRDAGGGAPHA